MSRKLAVLPLIIALLALSSCGTKLPDISEYGDAQITVVGLTDSEFTITPNELAKLELVNRSASGGSAKAGTVRNLNRN
jgi:hypothetical protein